MRRSAGKTLAALALALTTGLAIAGPAHAEDQDWSQGSIHYVTGTAFYSTGFSSHVHQDWVSDAITFTDVLSYAQSNGGLNPSSVQLDDTWQIDGVTLGPCQVGSNVSCNVGGSQTTATATSRSSGSDIIHRFDSIGLGGGVVTWVGEWTKASFVVGSNLYVANASQGQGL